MKKVKSNLRLILGFALILAVACSLVMSGMLAKYRTEMVIANEVDYTNTLAESFKLLDVPVTVNEDGSYTADTSSGAQPTDGFSYKLIPGITLPAAPYVEIKNKTVIPAYLYLEVENTGGVGLTYDSGWTQLGVTGKKGGTVFSYGSDALVGSDSETDSVLTIPTFTADTLSKLPDGNGTEGKIKVYAYMVQKAGEQTAEEAYEHAPRPS